MTHEKVVRIACKSADLMSIHDMVYFQHDLKSLSEQNYLRLKTEIIETGYGFPIKIWIDESDHKNYICGGHQTYRTLIQMEQEGWEVPPVPVSYTFAKDFFEAKRRVLQDISTFGKVEKEGLFSFMTQANIEIDDLVKSFDIPQVSLNAERFKLEYFAETTTVSAHERRVSGTVEEETPEGTTRSDRCPNCGYDLK